MALHDKVMSLADAISRFVPDRVSVAMGTCLESMIPFAAGHELIRQHRRELTLVGPISDMLFDQLIGAGCVARVQAAWIGNVSAGLGHAYRRAAEQGIPRSVTVEDYTNYTISLALFAGAHGIPFVPSPSGSGSDITRNHPGFAEGISPFDREKVLLVRALRPEVAVVAVQRADAEGNAHLWGNLGITEEAGLAADGVILLAEEIVEREVILSDPNRVLFPAFLIRAVVHCPGACHPSPVQGHYRRDHEFYAEYHQQTRTVEGTNAWLDRWVYGLRDHAAYLAQLGRERWETLRRMRPAPAAAVDYAW